MNETPIDPSANGDHGRILHNGRFGIGNKFGKGNPLAGKVSQLRAALVNAVSDEDIVEIAKSLLESAKRGNFNSAKLVLTYICGKSLAVEIPGVGPTDRATEDQSTVAPMSEPPEPPEPITPENVEEQRQIRIQRLQLLRTSTEELPINRTEGC